VTVRLMANENFARDLVFALRGAGHDTLAALRVECPWEGHVATIEADRIRLHALPRR